MNIIHAFGFSKDEPKAMSDFLYPTQADNGREWFGNLLMDWRQSKNQYLCFPFMSFRPRTLPEGDGFWMYMYYRLGQTDIETLKGKVKYRIHVKAWAETPFKTASTHRIDFGGNEKVWFLCDRAEEIKNKDGSFLDLHDFSHRDGKQLSSTIRTSIAPVTCDRKDIQVVTVYP